MFCFRRPPPPLHPSVAWRPSPTASVNLSIKADPPPDPARENFPSLSIAAGKPPPILQQNVSPADATRTPLFIGFTRNWPILQQAVVSYLTAGWPAKDIYVVDNTGTMDSNTLGLLTLQNPFYVNYTRLKDSFGVNVVVTPTLLTFAQLQNFFLYTAITNGWENYWWSHMDSVAVSYEDRLPYESLHTRVLKDFAASKKPWNWALKFYAYDRLALVNVAAYKSVGGWDTHIPFYTTDCDFHQRIEMAGWKLPNVDVGMVFDVGDTLQDLAEMYPKNKEEGLNSERYKRIVKEFREIDHAKITADNPDGRNFWQGRQRGGKGEPFYRDPLVCTHLRLRLKFPENIAGKFGDKVINEGNNRASNKESICSSTWGNMCLRKSGDITIAISSKREGDQKMRGRNQKIFWIILGRHLGPVRHSLFR
jgi:hypothetical protein